MPGPAGRRDDPAAPVGARAAHATRDGSVAVDGVSFAYTPGREVLGDVDLRSRRASASR